MATKTKTAAKKTTSKKTATTKPATAKKTATKKPAAKKAPAKTGDKKMSALDAAAKVLSDSEQSLTAKQMIERMATRGYWTSPGGKTPHATLYTVVTKVPNLAP